VAGIVAQPRQVLTATAWPAADDSRPASVRRSAACDSQHLRLSHRAQYRSAAFAQWSSACARFGKKQTFWNAGDAASQSLATVGAREPPICMPILWPLRLSKLCPNDRYEPLSSVAARAVVDVIPYLWAQWLYLHSPHAV
jgi:hypothetical protein